MTKIVETLFIFSCLLFFTGTLEAQTYYYNTSKTFSENGYTYQCDTNTKEGTVTLYNKANKYTYTKQAYKTGDSSSLDYDVFMGKISLIKSDTWTKQKCYSIVNNAFSTAEKQRLKGIKFGVTMTIDTSTGKVIEVDFGFIYKHGFGTIPVSVYRKIEVELKNNVWFTLTDTGKKLTFIKRGWMHEVE